MEQNISFCFTTWIFALSCLCVPLLGISGRNERPIIGVLAQSSKGEKWSKHGDTYIRSSYVKFVEMGGARAVPIRVGESDEYYEDLFSKINGALFPGGSVGILSSGYAIAGKKLYEMAIKASANGDFFPLWGTCQGFQLLSAMTADADLLTDCDAEDISLPLNFTSDFRRSRLFKNLPNNLQQAVTKYDMTQNYHHFCLTPKTFQKCDKLKSFYNVLSTNLDRKGVQFISTMEAYKYPFYGVQYHPEKSVFDWDVKLAVDHEELAVGYTQYLADFFVEEARKSSHYFSSPAEEAKVLFDNYQPVYMGAPSFYSVYVFNLTKSSQREHLQSVNGKETDEEESLGQESVPVRSMFMLQMFAIIAVIATLALLILLAVTRIRPVTLKYKVIEIEPLGRDEKLLVA